MPNLTDLFLSSSEGVYVAFLREFTTQSASSFDFTETTSTLINSVWGDLQAAGEQLVDAERGIRFPKAWTFYSNPLSLVVEGDILTVVGSTTIFEIHGVEAWTLDGTHWELELGIRR